MKNLQPLAAIIFFSLIIIRGAAQPAYTWANSMGGTSDEMGYSIRADVSGNTYVTGYFNGTANFNPSGSANLTSQGGQDIFLAKYDPSGGYLWAFSIGSTGNDIGNSLAVDASGVFITGSFKGAADFDPGAGTTTLANMGLDDIFFARYDVSGNLVWAESIGTTANDEGYGIAADAAGNTHIAGTFGGGGGGTADFDPGAGTANLTTNVVNSDIFFAKYDASGNYLWAKAISSLGADIAHAITVDASGNVYITGEYSGTADFDPNGGVSNMTPVANMDIFFGKYSSAGALTWAKSIGGAGADIGYGITVDGSGSNVYITGIFNGTVDFNPAGATNNLVAPCCAPDGFFGKYTSAGIYVWAGNMGGSTTDEAHGIAVDGSGNVYVSGFFWSTADFDPSASVANMTAVGNYDGFFAKYSAAGAYQWAAQIGSSSFDYVYGIDVDASCNIYITGTFNATADFDPGSATANLTTHGSYDIFAGKYGCTALPINLRYFNADFLKDKTVKISWSASDEVNTDYFTVEKSKDASIFEPMCSIKNNTESTAVKNYSATDAHPLPGINYYRLKQVDYDGKYSYSDIISATSGEIHKLPVRLYPNPAGETLFYEFPAAGENISIRVKDIFGNTLMRQDIKYTEGIYTGKLNTGMLQRGMYFFIINNGTEQNQIRFVREQ